MACYYPKAPSLVAYWENILNRVNAVTEVPPTHWDWRLYYDPDPRAADKIISKWGGFLEDIPFDPLVYGITPNSLHSIEPLQLYLLEAVRQALADAGYSDRPFDRERTAAILGIGGGGSPLAVSYGFRTCLPLLDTVAGLGISGDEVLKKADKLLPEWTEDSFPGILVNVAVGRVANRFNLGGANYAIDAACGSSLAAVQACVRELETGTSDVAVAMGADTVQTPYAYMAFSKTHALSPRGRCRPFDAAADGIVLSEGVAAVILKRLADAERDGDRIYAVIKGMGASSDGRDKGLTAPRAEGQLRALRTGLRPGRRLAGAGRADRGPRHRHRGRRPDRGPGARSSIPRSRRPATVVCRRLGQVDDRPHQVCRRHRRADQDDAGPAPQRAAADAGRDAEPQGELRGGAAVPQHRGRPWVHGAAQPRCAGVSAFGFGGTNFHAVLEENANDVHGEPDACPAHWPAELLGLAAAKQRKSSWGGRASVGKPLCRAPSRPSPIWPRRCGRPTGRSRCSRPWPSSPRRSRTSRKSSPSPSMRCGRQRQDSMTRAASTSPSKPVASGKVAFLFPGQGSQYPNMLGQLAMTFPEVREAIDRAETIWRTGWKSRSASFIFPPTAFSPEQEQAMTARL